MAYLDLLAATARVVGGSLSDATHSPKVLATLLPYWYSGRDMADSTGVAGLAGCSALPFEVIGDTPVAMIVPGHWGRSLGAPSYPVQGHKYDEDTLIVRVMVGHDDMTTQMLRLVNFRLTVPAAFEAHMQMFNAAGVVTADCSDGQFAEREWPAGTIYYALEFFVHIQWSFAVTYAP